MTRLIKRCNDFGAGGVSVAIGELAPGLVINLDKVPKKYEGLDGTELAISESQERMAVVIAAKDLKAFMDAADEENLEATVVAEVSKDPRLVMYWRGEKSSIFRVPSSIRMGFPKRLTLKWKPLRRLLLSMKSPNKCRAFRPSRIAGSVTWTA